MAVPISVWLGEAAAANKMYNFKAVPRAERHGGPLSALHNFAVQFDGDPVALQMEFGDQLGQRHRRSEGLKRSLLPVQEDVERHSSSVAGADTNSFLSYKLSWSVLRIIRRCSQAISAVLAPYQFTATSPPSHRWRMRRIGTISRHSAKTSRLSRIRI